MSRADNRCLQTRGGGTCLWPVRDKRRATIKALGILQRNLGRRITRPELRYLRDSELWHEFLWRVVRGQTLALPWGYVEEGPLTAADLEEFIAVSLKDYHAGRTDAPEEPPPATRLPRRGGEGPARIERTRAAKQRIRNGV